MLLPVTKSFLVLLAISLGMGLFDGCFISLLGPIAFDICGRSGATQAIGFLLGMCSIPLTVGPPIAGLLYDHTGNDSNDLPQVSIKMNKKLTCGQGSENYYFFTIFMQSQMNN